MEFKILRQFRRRQHKLVGHFDGVRIDAVCGWLCDRSRPQVRLRVSLKTAEQTIVATADHYRRDVRAAGFGDGHCGFVVPRRVFAAPETIRCFAENGWELPRAVPPAYGADMHRGSLHLLVDPPGQPGTPLTGYLVDDTVPHRRHLLGLAVAGTVIATERATLYRDDARKIGGSGFNGFAFALPADRPHGPISILALESGTRFEDPWPAGTP